MPAISANNSFNIQVMTFNLLFSNNNYADIKKVVENNSPDIIGLQEVFPKKADKIKKLFISEYPYQTFRPFKNSHTHNIALLSKYPITNVTVLPEEKIERGLLVTLDIGNQKQINAIVAHLYPNYPSHKFLELAETWYSRRLAQTLYLRQVIKNLNLPTVMMCDCNFTDTSETYSIIKSVMDDSFYQAGWGFGHSLQTSFFPVGRIDYVWHTKEFKAVNAYVAEGGGSDHLPVSATLSITR